MSRNSTRLFVVPALSGIAFILMGAPFTGSAQTPPRDSQAPPQAQHFTADQLTELVAPIALYPDPLLSQVLVASTYPMEVVEAQQWMQQHSKLKGAQLAEAAKQQPWDPSVQALVAFPDVLKLLNQDIRWTQDLGNAFLAQPADVMAAVQRLRASAQANGRLESTPQQTVSTETQHGQQAIVIESANPDVVYVPIYDPSYVWGSGEGSYGWGSGTDLSYWGGSDGWGWGSNWFGDAVFVNNNFLGRHGFRGDWDRGTNRERWEHNPDHRLGVPYPNRQLAGRYQAASLASRANRVGSGIPNSVNRPNAGNVFPGARPDNRPNANRMATPVTPPRVSPQGGAARGFPMPQRPPMRIPPPNNPGFGRGHFGGPPPMRMAPPIHPPFGGGGPPRPPGPPR